jgi:hypothetical protein
MLHFRKFGRHCLVMTIAATALPFIASPLFADSVPESIRIQQQAEKAYEARPVVPIDRGNAHHRDAGKDDGEGAGGAYVPTQHPSTAPPVRHDLNN